MEAYFIIYDFMVKDLHLSGCDLLTFALIYSFTYNTEAGCFVGKQEYIAASIGANRQTVNRSIARLAGMGLIEVTTDKRNGKFKKYVSKIHTANVAKSDSNLSNKQTDICRKKRHHYSDNNMDIYNDKKKAHCKSAPSYNIEKYNAFVENFELKYQKSH